MTFDSLPESVRIVVEAAQNKKAVGITVLDLREVGGFTSYFVICTGFSTPQVKAICDDSGRAALQTFEAFARTP